MDDFKMKKDILQWEKKYDRVNMCFDGEVAIFGGHYTLKQCLKIIEHENYDEPTEYEDYYVYHKYAKWGVAYMDGERQYGFIIFDQNKKGRVPVTYMSKEKLKSPLVRNTTKEDKEQ